MASSAVGAAPTSVPPAIQQVLDAMTDAPAWIRNGRHDILAMNQLARARDRALPAIRSDRLHALAHRRALRRRPELTP